MKAEGPAVEVVGLTRTHRVGENVVRSLDDVSLTVERGEIVAVTGPSGSGKSTLFFLVAGLDRPDSGTVRVAGVDWRTLADSDRARFRRRTCSLIVQGLALLPQATAAENVEVPLLLEGIGLDERQERVAGALARMELEEHAAKLPDQLSGGQQQRVAIARSLVTGPSVVLADEPTASLDSDTGQVVTRLLVELARERAAAVVLVTHDEAVAAHADRVVGLRSGRIEST